MDHAGFCRLEWDIRPLSMTATKNMLELKDHEFVKHCGVEDSPFNVHLAERFREVLAEFSDSRICKASSITPLMKTETDLGIIYLDSLDLVDFALALEAEGYCFTPSSLKEVKQINEQDKTVGELFHTLLFGLKHEREENSSS